MGAYVDVQALVALQYSARGFSIRSRKRVQSMLSGRHTSRMRGQGLDFEELRSYVFGDDIRTLDWRVTARLQKPFVRVFTEERDRPVMLLVDQRINMFFGSRLSTKSTTAAEVAALCAWSAYAQGDRVGALVFNDSEMEEFQAKRSRSATVRILAGIARQNQSLNANSRERSNPGQLHKALDRLQRIARRNFTIFLIGDFDGTDSTTSGFMSDLARSNDVAVFLVRDPFDENLPAEGELIVGDGRLQAELPFHRGAFREKMLKASRRRIGDILAWRQELQIPVLSVSTAEDTAPQVRRLLGRINARPRR